TAVGPILQGLSAPVNDLSRGCSADEIYKTLLITSNQAINRE
ncbi:MAG: phosphate acyltransferase, partial [Sodaliphilus sp.]|nr:phosphate acyltransferase [Sodaliphilus sp.]